MKIASFRICYTSLLLVCVTSLLLFTQRVICSFWASNAVVGGVADDRGRPSKMQTKSDLQKICCPNAVVWHGRGLVPAVSARNQPTSSNVSHVQAKCSTVSHRPKMFWGWFTAPSSSLHDVFSVSRLSRQNVEASARGIGPNPSNLP